MSLPNLCTDVIQPFLRVKAGLGLLGDVRDDTLLLGGGSQPDPQVSRQDTGEQHDRQEDNQRERKLRGGHADESRAGLDWNHDSVFLRLLVNSKGQVSSRHHPDDPVNPNGGQRHLPGLSPAFVPWSTSSSLKISLQGQWRRQSVTYIRMGVLQQPWTKSRVQSFRALVRTVVSADLDGALEVYLHRVRELERLEVGVGQD